MIETFILALREEISKLAMEMPAALATKQPYGMGQRVRRTLGIVGKAQKGLPGMVGTVMNGANTSTVGGVPKGMGAHGASTPPAVSSGAHGMKTAEPLVIPVPKMKPLFGGMTPVKPNMQINQKPTPANPERVSLASAYPSGEDVLKALGFGSELVVDRIQSKEAGRARLLATIEAIDELQTAKTAEAMVPILIKLAEIRKEAWMGEALRAAGGLGSRMVRNKAFWGVGAAGGAAYGMGKLFKGTVDMATSQKERQTKSIQSTTGGSNP